ncbi:MAG: hypothetical protein ACOCVC_04840 [Spirochaeta sp.]
MLSVSAAGSREDPIDQASIYIEEQRYNEALQLLAESIKQDPERIWEAARLIQGISQARSEYNDEWKDLIRSLREEPDNSEQALEIIQRMETIDRFPNPRTTQQVRDARRTVRFRYNQTEYLEIMEDSAGLLDQDRYQDALARYASGFTLFQEEFIEADYGNIFENRILGLTEDLAQTVDEISSVIESIENFFPSSAQDVADLQALTDTSENVLPLFYTLLDLRQAAVEIALELETQNERIPQMNEELEQDWYLVFLNRFALGRRDIETPEGIAGAVVKVAEDMLGELIREAASTADQMYAQAQSAFDEAQWEPSEELWQDVYQYAIQMEELEVFFQDLHEQTFEMPDTERMLANRQGVRQLIATLQQHGTILADVSSELSSFTGLAALDNKEPEVLGRNAEELQGFKDRIRGYMNLVGPDDQEMEFYERISQYYSVFFNRLEEWDNRITSAQVNLYAAAAAERELSFITLLAEFDSIIATAEQEISGVAVEVTDDSEAAAVRRYPQNAAPRLQQLLERADQASDQLDDYLLFLADIPPDPAAAESIQEYQLSGERLSQRLFQLQSQAGSLLADAETALELAGTADSNGRELLSAARTALDQRNIDEARRLLNEADNQFFEALEYRYDEDVREEYQSLVSTLGQEIVETQTVIVIEQVRERINRGRALFQQDDFFAAEQILQEAQDMWETVNPGEPNPEIRNWIGLVRAALNLQTNREINEESPLYYTLIPFLNRAQTQYREGLQAMEAGSQSRGTELFDQAVDNLNAVISAQPFNQEARVLQLRIQQRLDPDGFQQTFEARYNDALERRATDPENALVDLQDLATIQPDYPGIDQAIYQLEITLGLRQAPVDRSAEIESRNLVSRARQVAAGGSREQLQAAVGLLEEAIQLNPENQDAIVLLDEYRIRIGGRVTTSISFEAQQRFRRAEDLFVQGDIAASYAIVQQLLQSQQNQRYTPLINLQRRLENRLGI